MQYIRTTAAGEVIEVVKTVDGDGLTPLHFVGFTALPDAPAVYAGDTVDGGTVTGIGPAHQRAIRDRRDGQLNPVLWMRDRHRDEVEMGRPTTLTEAEFSALLVYVQALRDVPDQAVTFDAVVWPVWPGGAA